ncbi:MAG: DUF642 domain-containing protein [Patescibacteria group bacterium]
MNIFTSTNRATARFLAVVTAVSMMLSAFPASFFVAHAAADGLVTGAVLANPSSGPESFTISYSGTGALDLFNWEVKDAASFSYTFGAVTLATGESYKVCQDVAPTSTCDAIWGTSNVWNNSGSESFILEDNEGNEVLNVSFTNANLDQTYSGEAAVQQSDPLPTAKELNGIFECWEDDPNNDGKYIAYFGYENKTGVTTTIPFGENNNVTPSSFESKFIEEFGLPDTVAGRPGRTPFNQGAPIKIDNWDGSNIVWNLLGSTDTAGLAGTKCPIPEPEVREKTVVVKEDELALSVPSDWYFWVDSDAESGDTNVPTTTSKAGRYEFSFDPDTQKIGEGNVLLTLPEAGDQYGIATNNFAGTRLDALTMLMYSTYKIAEDNVTNIALAFNFDENLDDDVETWQGRLIFEPYHSNPSSDTEALNEWKTWDALAGKWWASSGSALGGACTQGSPCTAAEVLTIAPHAGIQVGELGQFFLKGGSSNAGLESHVDELVIGVLADNVIHKTTYDFEPTEIIIPPVCQIGENLLENPSFEDPAISQSWTLSSITDWVVTKVSDDSSITGEIWRGLFGPASDGEQNLELDTTAPSKITQTIETIPGATYELRFDFSPRPRTGENDNKVQALVDDIEVLSATGSGNGLSEKSWDTHTTTFVATGEETDISFADMGDANGLGSLIDNTAVCFVKEPEPEVYQCEAGLLYLDTETDAPAQSSLHTVNEMTGAATLFGTYDIDLFPVLAVSSDEQVYSINRATGELVTLDNDLGAITTIGNTGIKSKKPVAMEFAPDGTLYALTENNDALYKINPVSGAATKLHDLDLDVAGGDVVYEDDVIVYVRNKGQVYSIDSMSYAETLLGTLAVGNQRITSAAGKDGTYYAYTREDGFYPFTLSPFVADTPLLQTGPFAWGDGSFCPVPEDQITIVAHKIVCTDESQLPNYGKGGPDMDESTAADWVANNDSCRLEPDWEFQWGPKNAFDPGDEFMGEAGDPWNTFGPTDQDGKASITLSADDYREGKHLWFREVLQEGYIPFTHEAEGKRNTDDVTAEMYCHIDVKNYDNYDRIDDLKNGETYYCVAWNVEKPKLTCEPGVNLITNPSFEAPEVDGAWDIFDLTTYPALAWTVEFVDDFAGAPDEASLELQRDVQGWAASDGDQYAELDGDWEGPSGGGSEEASVKITQGIPTIPGENYVLSWDFSPRPDTNAAQNQLEVLVDGDVEVTNGMAGGSDVAWASDSYSFTAENYVTDISFQDAGVPNSSGTFLDNVSLVCEEAPKCSIEMVSDSGTVVVEGNTYATSTYVHPNWTADIDDATWIWNSEFVENPDQDETYTFKETFTVSGPHTGLLEVAADNRYKAYLNGELVIDRSGQNNNFQSHTQTSKDVTSALVEGNNELVIEVTNVGNQNANNRQNPAGLLYKLTVDGLAQCAVTTMPDPEEPKEFYVDGYKWSDENGNGEKDDQEQYLPNWTIFASNGETEVSTTTDTEGYYYFWLPEGEWTISEANQIGWTQTAPEDPGVCVFEYANGGEYRCDFGNQFQDNQQQLYMLDGFVWNDEDEDDVIDEEESRLSGWTVKATDGEQTFSTTTDSTGYYKLNVPAGTWTITQVTQGGWQNVFPDSGEHVVTVPEVVATTFLQSVREFIIPTAHAQVPSFGPFNFGLIEVADTPSGGGGSGGSSAPRCTLFEADEDNGEVTLTWETRRTTDIVLFANGTEIFSSDDPTDVDDGSFETTITEDTTFLMEVSRGSRTRTCEVEVSPTGDGQGGDLVTPEGIVAGEQVSIVPLGAPNAGAGGAQAAGSVVNLAILVVFFGFLLYTRRNATE